ncbi:MAG TPA: TIGR04086 family membrane protein [Thermoanaerobacterales bacterium]|nr:TIGR04086 family membrane protein [Thermoanaerobacterales bacterium]
MQFDINTHNKKDSLESFLYILKGVLLSYILTLICFLIFAGIINLTSISYNIIPISTIVISAICIIISAFYISKATTNRGWLRGGSVGLLYVLILLVAGIFLVPDFNLTYFTLIKILIGFIIGSVGGILGVNM